MNAKALRIAVAILWLLCALSALMSQLPFMIFAASGSGSPTALMKMLLPTLAVTVFAVLLLANHKAARYLGYLIAIVSLIVIGAVLTIAVRAKDFSLPMLGLVLPLALIAATFVASHRAGGSPKVAG